MHALFYNYGHHLSKFWALYAILDCLKMKSTTQTETWNFLRSRGKLKWLLGHGFWFPRSRVNGPDPFFLPWEPKSVAQKPAKQLQFSPLFNLFISLFLFIVFFINFPLFSLIGLILPMIITDGNAWCLPRVEPKIFPPIFPLSRTAFIALTWILEVLVCAAVPSLRIQSHNVCGPSDLRN